MQYAYFIKKGDIMNKLRNAIFLVFFFLMMGCATPTKTIMDITEVKNLDTLYIGTLQQKTVGEPMIEKTHKILIYRKGFIAESDYTPPSAMTIQLPMVARDSEWFCPRIHENGNYLCTPKLGWGLITSLGFPRISNYYSLIISPSGIPIGLTEVGVVATFPEQPKIFKITEIADIQKGSFKQELIYNGQSKDAVRIAYREFKDDFARPAFSQDLTYDMTESKEIGFRGMIIEVVEATNSFIKFIVKQPMTQ